MGVDALLRATEECTTAKSSIGGLPTFEAMFYGVHSSCQYREHAKEITHVQRMSGRCICHKGWCGEGRARKVNVAHLLRIKEVTDSELKDHHVDEMHLQHQSVKSAVDLRTCRIGTCLDLWMHVRHNGVIVRHN